jgi:hypothetical protein
LSPIIIIIIIITDTEIDEIKESFRPRMQDNMEDQLREEQTNNAGATKNTCYYRTET